MVVLEAFREGTPIVARHLGPFPEIIGQSGGGLLFDGAEDLVSALTRLASDEGLRKRLGKSAARAFETRWSETAAMRRYFEIIYQLARERGMGGILDRLPDETGQPPSRTIT